MNGGVHILANVSQDDRFGDTQQRRDLERWGCVEDTVLLPVDLLIVSDSPRTESEDLEHVRALAESWELLPPILVRRPTMRVIDGMHRLSAAKFRGENRIRARFVDSDDDDAFVLAVQLNVVHGLPLSWKDRNNAAERIIRTYPHRSDRAIATMTGLSHKTIGSIRRRSVGENLQSNTRMGRDGRLRPTDRTARRERAAALVFENDDVPLRQISRAAGISVSTAKQVRDEVRSRATAAASDTHADKTDVQPGGTKARRREQPLADEANIVNGVAWVVNALKKDPSVRHTDAGRSLLRLLSVHTLNPDERRCLVDSVPAHCRESVAQAARSCAEFWDRFARQLADTDT